MKIFSKTRKRNRTIFKFIGIPYCWKIADKYYSKYKKSYFCGAINILRKFDIDNYKSEHNIDFLRVLKVKIKEENEYKWYYINGKLIRKIPERELLKQKYFNRIDKSHDQVYILTANSGETYLFLKYVLDVLIKKDGAKNPILIATKKYHQDMIKMICPEIPYVYIGYVYANIKMYKFEIDGMFFTKIFSREHFMHVEKLLRAGDKEAHYFKSILETLDIKENEIKPRKVIGIEKSKKSMLKKIKKTGLNLDNFVFISPEANSCELLPVSYWENLIKDLQKQGYDIFANLRLDNVPLKGVEYKTCPLSYSEAYELVKYAKKLYSLRSGFTEFLLDTDVPMEVYYTKFRNNDITAEQIMSGFSLLRLPEVSGKPIEENLYSEV